ncbi:baseplate assembly protein [Kosakonia sacchari]|uniref:Baseplate assembly protein n=1 Tax=Kosakonia sacchari TaxID=1158459 RepID=A0ABZ0MTF1_9ENTR|nr:baseplate assembly protein [Kosakonia sacchari]WOZ78526.1 baseplate assembly protein [Kosakonia sacchari]
MPIIDLSQLPAPDVVEELDYEAILNDRKATLISLFPTDEQEALARTLALESEPLTKFLQENAYREVMWRSRVNEAARAVMLAYAAGKDLDVMAANSNTARLVVSPADDSTIPPTPAVMESDKDLRLRAQQAFEGLSVAGPEGAYEYHGRSADGRVADISVISPNPAYITISVLSREGDGRASDELIAIVDKALNAEDVRPVGDRVTVQSAEIVPYQINATLYFYPGPESEPIRQAAEQQLKAYINAQRRLGRDIRQSAIYAALHVEGVQRVELSAPQSDLVLAKNQASYCTAWSINAGGTDE